MSRTEKLYEILLLLFIVLLNYAFGGPNEKRLLHHLLDKYNIIERPITNQSYPTVVKFGIILKEIIDVDISNQILITNSWLHIEWHDTNMIWNSSEFGNVSNLRIPPHRIWKPDILFYNSGDEGFDATYSTSVIVQNDGSCIYVPPGIFKGVCKMDLSWFPFDEQKCDIKFGSWTYPISLLDLELRNDEGDTSSINGNGEWEVLGFPAKRSVEHYPCCPDPFVDVTFTLHIKRRPQQYIYGLIIPVIFISSMALLSFLIPPDSSAKLIFGPVTLIALLYFLNTCSFPPTTKGSAPLITKYMTCLMCIVFASVLASITVFNLSKQPKHKVENIPKWLRVIFLDFLPPYLLITLPKDDPNKVDEHEMHQNNFQEQPHHQTNTSDSRLGTSPNNLPNDNEKEFGITANNVKNHSTRQEWTSAAMVLDRVCLLLFSGLTIIVTIVSFTSVR